MKDEKVLWHAIGWNGEVNNHSDIDDKPPELEFQKHLESLLNPPTDDNDVVPEDYYMNVPVLDDPIVMKEVDDVIMKLKPNKGAGPDGLSPGLFRWFPKSWISILLLLLNLVFICGYPLCWGAARLIMLFKKGQPMDCDNYRGISVINSSAKVYDYIINNRLMLWFKPSREQAGAQPKRGYMEHIVSAIAHVI